MEEDLANKSMNGIVPELDKEISRKEVKEAIKQLKSGKTAGCDGLLP